MPTKLTTQDFINRARATHGDKYGYALSVYESAHQKVMINCPEHGVFKQSPNSHLSGSGCSCCSKNKKPNHSEFVNQASSIHESKYDYSLSCYINAITKIKIVCPYHGEFDQKPSTHLLGKGCPVCGVDKRKTTRSDFIKEASKVHNNIYSYYLVDYVNARTKVIILCPHHGLFEQTPDNHIKGVACPGCANYGFDRTRKAFLYVLRSECGKYMKIGVTHNPEQRHNKLKRDTPFPFECIELIEGQGDHIADMEKELLSCYNNAEFKETFDGYTEWRLWDDSIRHKLHSSKLQG